MDTLDYRIALRAGKEIRICFPDGSTCIADGISDVVATEGYAERYEVVDPVHRLGASPRIAVIDADLIGRGSHRFPNLASEKIAAYWKGRGAVVELRLSYRNLEQFDQVYISKVFTDTPFPDDIRESDRIHLGGTGFFFDKAPNLPEEIEHHMPDYHLYDGYINREMARMEARCKAKGMVFNRGVCMEQFRYYMDYSIGYLTRGCFRKCEFCINRKYDRVCPHSPLEEFYDPERKKICLLDDNFFGYGYGWKGLLKSLRETGKPFIFRQGLDERILTRERCELLFSSNYDGNYTFAFDRIEDYDLIERKLRMIREYSKAENVRFYVLVGYKGTGVEDIVNAFRRIELLGRYGCIPYIMRYASKEGAPWKESEYRGMYSVLASWCNQVNCFKKLSIRQYVQKKQALLKKDMPCAPARYLEEFEEKHPDVAERFFDMVFGVN